MSPFPLRFRVWLSVGLLAILLLGIPNLVAGGATNADADTETDINVDTVTEAEATQGVEQSVIDSAAAEIQAQIDLEAELNQQQSNGENALDPSSSEAQSLDLSSSGRPLSVFSFLSEVESPSSSSSLHTRDVENQLDTIATEIESLFKNKAEESAEAEAEANEEVAEQDARQQRRSARWSKHAAAANSGNTNPRARAQPSTDATLKKVAPVGQKSSSSSPSPRQKKLIARLDAYRVARGSQDVSTLEATAHARATVNSGYSMPSAYAPGVVGGVPPVAATMPFQGQAAANPLAWLGVQPAAAQAQAASPAASIAGVGALLQVLKQAQEQQEAANMLTRIGTLLNVAAAARPAVVAQPIPSFGYGQPLLATPPGAYLQPGLMAPGALPGQTLLSPSYPSFIPGDQASIAHQSEQPNPFEAHQP